MVNSCQPRLRIGVLGSGKGSNLKAIAQAACSHDARYEVAIVLSDVASAGILTLAKEYNIKATFISPGPYKTKLSEEAEQQFIDALQEANVDLVVLAGFMRIMKEKLLAAFPEKIINIHPSLLPMFPGLEAWKQALDAKVRETGCTVHYVDHGIDTGKILGQQRVPVFPNDTDETLHARIHEVEHQLYPKIIQEIAQKS